MVTANWADRIDPEFLPGGPLPPMGLGPHNLETVRDSLNKRRAEAVPLLDTSGVTVEELELELSDRTTVVRVYRPATGEALPVVLYCHSGAFVLGNLDTDQQRCLDLARRARCVVVSVGYRLAPEHPYPAGLDDCFEAFAVLVARPELIGGDGRRWAVSGSSAGGGMAAALALRLRDEMPTVTLRFQLLHQPMLDRRSDTGSMREFVSTPFFDADSARFAWRVYSGDDDVPDATYLSPAEATDLGGLPPALVACSEIDPLRDEAIDYARRLLDAGVPTELHVYPGTAHGFDSVAPGSTAAQSAIEEQSAALARAFR